MKATFEICRHCGNLVELVRDAGVPVVCCGEKMEKLVPNTVDASGEKHTPAVTVNGDEVLVQVGVVTHPMLDAHYIQWIALETEHGLQRRYLQPGEAPEARFLLAGDHAVAAYAYCNLHGLWMTTL